jgi:hypothetical protein
VTKKRALILLGGMWHDFDGFARSIAPLLEAAGWQVESSYNLELLTRLDDPPCDLALSYTCFTQHAEGLDNSGPELMSAAQIDGLTRWVRDGGAFLSVHGASVCGKSGKGLQELTGGFFVEHPPAFTFTVYPVYGPHPITDGIEAFSVHDEMYIEQCDPSVNVHMLTVDRGVAHPLVWSKSEGRGRVAHIAPGHFEAVWELEPYRRLMLQTIGWLTAQGTESPK